MEIIKKYKQDKPVHDLIFPDLKGLDNLDDDFNVQHRIKKRVRFVNHYLKEVAKKAEITKEVTCHISSHTFGQQAGDKIDIRTLQELYRHSILLLL